LSSAHQSLSLSSLLDSDEEEESDELFVAMETFFFDISFSTTLDSFVTTEEESDELFVAMETFFFDISFSTTLDSFVTTVSVSSSYASDGEEALELLLPEPV
jgi:hypothetical protein